MRGVNNQLRMLRSDRFRRFMLWRMSLNHWVMSVNGTLVEEQKHTFKGECAQFSFKKVSYLHSRWVQVPNLALTHKKWITV